MKPRLLSYNYIIKCFNTCLKYSVVWLCVLALVFIPDWTADSEYLRRMQVAMESEKVEIGISVTNTIKITQEDLIVASYKKEYIIESENKCLLNIDEEYYAGITEEFNIYENYCLLDGVIYMKRKDSLEEIQSNYRGDFRTFKDIILDQDIASSGIQINKEYFSEWKIKRGKTIELTAKINQEKAASFMGNDKEEFSNITLIYKITPKGKLIKMLLCYDIKTADTVSHTEIETAVNYNGSFEKPSWIVA